MKTRFNRIKRLIYISALITGVIFLSGYSKPSAKENKKGILPIRNVSATQTLSGKWMLAIDPENKGRAEGWFKSIRSESKVAVVPGVIQQVFPGYHGVAWYWFSFSPEFTRISGDRVLIRFGAVDYLADVWINGEHAGSYEGGEIPFEFDITNSLRLTGDNLLAVRVLNPTENSIDGYVLKETPHRNKSAKPSPGSPFNSGGIMYPVELRLVPATYITDIYVRPDIKTGNIGVTVSVRNTGQATTGTLDLDVAPGNGGSILQAVDQKAEFPVGLSEHELTISVSQPHLWSLDDPFLYRVTANLTSASKELHQQSVRCGFRDFRVVDGYFNLNGKRVFLKSTHTANLMPVGQLVSVVGDFGRRDMLYAKASGFNTVRFIAGIAYPEQLDLCDELGLMVYEECFAGWCLENSPKMAERFDRNTSSMILRDRNHPSVTIWGVLNETSNGPVFQHAVNFLPKLRDLDPTRLVLLNSGRFDQEFAIGSASNPGSSRWEHVWGIEGPNVPKIEGKLDHPSNEGAGDFHNYPRVPQSEKTNRYIQELGKDSKPVLLSEYGIGSQMNVINEWKHFEQAGARPDLEDGSWCREQSEALIADWKRLGFDNVYPFPEDMLRESLRLHARQRTIGFNLIRSNPKLCGYNLTGMLDHAMTGEGLWTYFREWKPSTFDAVSDGWSPLRWCMFTDPLNAYSGRTITVEAVLANEDVLKPGDYRVRFRVFGPDGPVWEKESVVKVPDPPVLAVPAIRETFELKGPAGQYSFAASLEEGGAPTGGQLLFYVSDPTTLPKIKGKVTLWGIDKKAEQWLSGHGLICQQLTTGILKQPEVILVGKPADAETNPQMWESLSVRMAKGSTVVFLSGQIFSKGTAGITWMPLKNKGICRTFNDWLYHKECVAKRHQVFDGLQGPGIMDWDYYGPVIPHEIFEGQETPDETIAASLATGNNTYPRGYGSGTLIGMYKLGEGRMILSTPYVLENLDSHPAADRLLLNLVLYAQEQILKKGK